MVSLDDYRAQLVAQMQACGLPRTVWESMVEYILQGHPVGEFLAAVLSNDLMKAAQKADAMNLPRLPDYVSFLVGAAPVGSFGSLAAYNEWRRTGGVLGRQQAREANNSRSGE